MAFNKRKIHKQALELAKTKKCFFIEQLVSFLPCSKTTFYEFYPLGSNELDAIKEILEKNKVEVKSAMYKKWFDSDNPTLQVALMKLIASDDEAHRLNGTSQKIEHSGELNITPLKWFGDE